MDLRIDAHNAKVYNCGGADPPPDDAKDSESNSSEHEDDEKTDTYTEEDIFEDDVVCVPHAVNSVGIRGFYLRGIAHRLTWSGITLSLESNEEMTLLLVCINKKVIIEEG